MKICKDYRSEPQIKYELKEEGVIIYTTANRFRVLYSWGSEKSRKKYSEK